MLADDWTEEQRAQFLIKDNVGFGEWDWNTLANEWDAEKLEAWGLELPPMDAIELEAEEDDYEMPEQIETDIVLGDLFEIGEHRLLCGDSTDSDAVAKLMNGQKADLLLTDPPYGIGIDGQKKSIALNPKHNRKHHEFRGWDNERPQQSTFELILSFANKGIIWGGNYFADLLPATRGWIYWSKGQDGLTMSDGELAWTTEDKPLRAVTVNRAKLQGSVHPTQKPIDVITFCINWANKPNLILDTFLGSGSTMVAAHQLKRKCYGIELDPKYCQVIIDRMIKLDPTLEIKRNGQTYNRQTTDGQ
jgi:site-specific DNA-methyltransferase (adenine-specific)